VDIDEERLDDLRRLARQESLPQLTPVHGQPADPRLPDAGLDAVVLVNTYHEIENPVPFLRQLARALRPGGRLVLVDSLEPEHRDDSREVQTDSHEIALEFARGDLRAAGFDILDARDPFVEEPWGDVQWMLVARRTARRPAPGRRAVPPRNPRR
jgi:SAM-dependent methyltransferase